jgi:GT2 family glycosyltransferase
LITVGIPVRNQLVYLRRAVKSVFRTQSLPMRLIVVDDASDVPTSRWLGELDRSRADVTVIRNASQEGFAYNANLILDATEGDPIVLLNTDTVVTSGWDAALQAVLARCPGAGLAGPSTSCAHTAQALLECRFGRFDLSDSEIEGRGGEIARRYRGQWEPLKHLGGFCYAIARCTFEDVGYFDERFGLGPYEENDYSDRAADKGYEAIWAKWAYVHHFGGRTFAAELAGRYSSLQSLAEARYRAKRRGPAQEEWVRRGGPGRLHEEE